MAERMIGPGTAPGRGPYHTHLQRKLDEAVEAVRRTGALAEGRAPRVGLVLGSGLGRFADSVEDPIAVPVRDIPHMPQPSVAGHAGALVFGRMAGVGVACLSGRVHLYEGHDAETITFGSRLLAELGCHSVLLTNAAGGIRVDLGPGRLMLIVDHINLTAENPLTGLHGAFVDMTTVYDPALVAAATRAAADTGVDLAQGVYAAVRGPSYETKAEINMLRVLGADAVGMSTALETIALRHAGVRVGAVSCITNFAAGLGDGELSHAEVTEVARRAEQAFSALMRRWIVHADEGQPSGRPQ